MGIVLVAFLAARASVNPGRDQYVNFETDQLISEGGEPVELDYQQIDTRKRCSCPQHSRDHEVLRGIVSCPGRLKWDGFRAIQSYVPLPAAARQLSTSTAQRAWHISANQKSFVLTVFISRLSPRASRLLESLYPPAPAHSVESSGRSAWRF